MLDQQTVSSQLAQIAEINKLQGKYLYQCGMLQLPNKIFEVYTVNVTQKNKPSFFRVFTM